MTFEEFGACWPVKTKSELIESLKTLKSNKNYKPYNQSNVDELLKNIVYADEDSPNVLVRYIDIIEESKQTFLGVA